jgi:glycosyltransferase involved in cell wall biosynthesis
VGQRHSIWRSVRGAAFHFGYSGYGQLSPRRYASIDEVAPERPVALIIPACNEAENLPHVLAAVPRDAISDIQVIVVDDGSTDETSEVANRCGADIVVRHESNKGLGAALRTGLITARSLDARLAVYIDADGEYDVAQMPSLLQPILNGRADYVLGSRFRGSIEGMPLVRRIGNHILSLSVSVLTGHWISDGQTGFRAFSRKALETAEIIHDYNYAQVLSMDLLRKGMRLAEVPVSYRRRTHGRSFISSRYLWRVPLGMLRELFSQ